MSDLRIPFPTERAAKRELSLLQWGVLINTTFPSALSEDAIINAWDLAQVRGLDVFSGHVAIVNQRRKVDNNWINQESCWLTLKAQIFVAHKTGAFAGIDAVTFGPMVERRYSGRQEHESGPNKQVDLVINVPEYVTATVYRFVNGQKCAFSDTVVFDDIVPKSYNVPTHMWLKSPIMMVSKCAKAAALRLAFSECDYSADEMAGQVLANNEVVDASPEATLASGAHSGSSIAGKPSLPASDFNEAPLMMEAVTSFDQIDAKDLRWLNRSIDPAIELGAFDEAIDNMKATLTPSLHGIGENLFRAAQAVLDDARGKNLWTYICQARNRQGSAFKMAQNELRSQAAARKLSQSGADAGCLLLAFFDAASSVVAHRAA